VSLEFLVPAAAPGPDGRTALARSPMERQAQAAGARFEVRDGWNVAVGYDGDEREALASAVGWADVSHLTKLEIAGGDALRPGVATRARGAWWCRVTADRALVIGDGGARDLVEDGVEVTTALAALTIAGPLARELLARFCALDLRDAATPVGGWRPGSVARTPGYVLREDADRFLVLFGWALGEYLWTTVADAAQRLGGAPVGVDALGPLPETAAEAARHA
jgi:glycine cleavage system aminomethyltransferase T